MASRHERCVGHRLVTRRSLVQVAPWLWGVVVASALTRFFFEFAPDEMFLNHEGNRYLYRALEFTDAIRAGYWSPQWATHFRGGLGGPYFGYYQPGFFYVVAAFMSVAPVLIALALGVWVFACVGYAGTFLLVRNAFGAACGALAGTMLLLATHVRNDLYERGDLSEFAGMMMLAPALAALVGWLERGGRRRWTALAVGAGACVVLHPAAGLLGYAMLGGTLIVWGLATRNVARPLVAAGALVAGAGIVAFYWMPLLLEWRYVRGGVASGPYSVTRHFVSPWALLSANESARLIRPALGATTLALTSIAIGLLAFRRSTLAPDQRRLALVLVVLVATSTVMVMEVSKPIWMTLPLIGLVQFPWRVLTVQAVALAGLAGCLPAVPRILPVVAAAVAVWPLASFAPINVRPDPYVDSAAALETLFVAPDVVDEWLPKTARPMGPSPQWREPTISAGVVDEFERSTGYLRVRVDAHGMATVTLPHYYFPLGWQATLSGHPLQLRPSKDGLMSAFVLGRGVIEARYFTTPARRAGLVVSGIFLLVTCGLGLVPWKRLDEGPAEGSLRGDVR
jgi:hypothetical protein